MNINSIFILLGLLFTHYYIYSPLFNSLSLSISISFLPKRCVPDTFLQLWSFFFFFPALGIVGSLSNDLLYSFSFLAINYLASKELDHFYFHAIYLKTFSGLIFLLAGELPPTMSSEEVFVWETFRGSPRAPDTIFKSFLHSTGPFLVGQC